MSKILTCSTLSVLLLSGLVGCDMNIPTTAAEQGKQDKDNELLLGGLLVGGLVVSALASSNSEPAHAPESQNAVHVYTDVERGQPTFHLSRQCSRLRHASSGEIQERTYGSVAATHAACRLCCRR